MERAKCSDGGEAKDDIPGNDQISKLLTVGIRNSRNMDLKFPEEEYI